MAYCRKCGNQIADGIKFCPKCGAAQSDNVQVSKKVKESKKFKESKKIDFKPVKKVFVAVLIIVAAVAAVSAFVKLTPKKVNLEDYYTPVFSGYDTVGRVKEIDHDMALIEAFISDKVEDVDSSEIRKMYRSIIVKTVPDNHLSNGDVVHVVIETNNSKLFEENGLELDTEGWDVTVTGLDELETIDPFSEENFSVEVYGIAPFASIRYGQINKMARVSGVNYTCNKDEDLSYGEKITFNVEELVEDSFSRKGYKVERNTYEYEIKDINKYVEDIADVDEAVLERMKEEVVAKIESYASSHDSMVTISDIKYEGALLLAGKEWHREDTNYVDVIYSGTVSDPREEAKYEPTKVYFNLQFRNIIEEPDGLQTYDNDPYKNKLPCDISFSLKIGWLDYCAGYMDIHKLYNDYAQTKLDRYSITVTDGLKELLN